MRTLFGYLPDLAAAWCLVGFLASLALRMAGAIGQPRWWPYVFLTSLGPVSAGVVVAEVIERRAKAKRGAFLQPIED